MSVEVNLVPLDYGRRWNIDITIDTPMLGELSKTIIYIKEPYRASLDDWRKITSGNCAMYPLNGFSLDDGYYQFYPNSENSVDSYTRIKEEVLRGKLSEVIDKAVELNLHFGYNDGSSSDDDSYPEDPYSEDY
jgi:hypothetical protein